MKRMLVTLATGAQHARACALGRHGVTSDVTVPGQAPCEMEIVSTAISLWMSLPFVACHPTWKRKHQMVEEEVSRHPLTLPEFEFRTAVTLALSQTLPWLPLTRNSVSTLDPELDPVWV